MSTSNASPNSTGLYSALGRLPSGIYILTMGTGEDATGMLVSWVQQAGFEPPMISLAIGKDRPITARLEAGEPFALNLVGEGQKKFLGHFGKGFAPGEPAFEGIELAETSIGVPALADSLATLECRAESHLDSSDHRILLAHVTGGSLRAEGPPMVHIRKRGDHY